jgi:hypothetical protein
LFPSHDRRPKWWSDSFKVISNVHVGDAAYHEVDGKSLWKQEFEPLNKLIDEGVEVYCWKSEKHLSWCSDEYIGKNGEYTHKALLIGIQSIKKETAEDVLRDIVEEYNERKQNDRYLWCKYTTKDLLERAKRALEGE